MEKGSISLCLEEGGYRILRELGCGGEGRVYLVCHLRTEQLRAAKVMSDVREDQMHELNMLKRLRHPALPRIFDVIGQGRQMCLIMEYIEGRHLEQALAGGMSEADILSVAEQLARVLVYLHTRKTPVFHLDIKPSNILIRADGSLALIDFGASIQGHPSQYRGYGTRGFAAPEQLSPGGEIDGRTDIYGYGAVLYYCKYGRPPNPKDLAIFRATHRFCAYRMSGIVKKCLFDNPGERFADSRQLLKAVCRVRKWYKYRICFIKSAWASLLFIFVLSFFYSSMSGGDISENVAGIAIRDMERGEESETESFQEETEDEIAAADVEYGRLLEIAGGLGFELAMQCYETAALLRPSDGTWYMELLDYIIADGSFSHEEEIALKKLIFDVDSESGKAAVELLAETEDYGDFAYRMGIAYWYYYEGTGGESAAAWWFERAIKSQQADPPDWMESARIHARIGSYYGMLGRTGAAVAQEDIVWEYWKDLKELWDQSELKGQELTIQWKIAGELLSLQILNAGLLRQKGEIESELLQLTGAIEQFLADNSRHGESDEWDELKKQCIAARVAVERAF